MLPPLFFDPILKRIRWGGRRLGTQLQKPIGPESDYAESWEMVDHGDDQSRVTSGPFAGWTLKQFVEEKNAELFGRHAGRDQFPLLIKFLDANDRLSLQVHPNDVQAKGYDPDENGKTEAWVIVHAEPGSCLYAGLKADVTAESFREHIEQGDVESCLNKWTVSPGDCVFIPAGTVHAIAEGIVLAEIQQSSDLTFRIHDWGRVGTDGQPRELHLEQAFACIDFDRGPVSASVPKTIDDTTEELVRCDQFVMNRHQFSAPLTLSTDERFHVLMMLNGAADLQWQEDSFPMPLGQSVLIPASSGEVTLVPNADQSCTVLSAHLPQRQATGNRVTAMIDNRESLPTR